MARSQRRSSISYLWLVLTGGVRHPWDNAVDSDTAVALSSNRHGVGVGGTWNVPGQRAFGLVLLENAEP